MGLRRGARSRSGDRQVTAHSPIAPFRGPLYQRVFWVLRQRIVDGQLEPGQQMQTEDELAAEFNVSRATVRQAISELAARQLVLRKQGKGTFVLPSSNHTVGPRLTGSLSDVVPHGAKIVHVEVARDGILPPNVAKTLGLDDRRGCVITRVRSSDDEIFSVTINYLPSHLGRLISDKDLRSESLLVLLKTQGFEIAWGEQTVRAELADIEVAERLEVDYGSPVLFAERILFDQSSRPLDVVASWYRGDRYEYRVQLTPGFLSDEQRHQRLKATP